MRVVLFGPPGVGKGSQAQFLSEREGFTHISTGILLRREMRNSSELGKNARVYIEAGKLVPGIFVRNLAEDAISKCNYKKFVLDGYPRTIEQAKWLYDFLDQKEAAIDTVLSLVVPDEVIIDRLSKRRVNKVTGENYHLDFKPPPEDLELGVIIQRKDDKPEAIKHRLEIYQAETSPVQNYYRKQHMLQEVDGTGTFEEVFDRIRTEIGISPA
ncbi:MAG: adenylate kinase [Bacteroidetes Order II. Incertae sedis bacterium]|jgi:adenylate kinase|nr:adenylate kinase [Bacteroidetes Order II. bacterium]MBT4602188.1 adenylate kinase [Bacteroidetes Order II. bacterium]MBT5250551.1 adenylate kinase [Bacteroidetes Order II. bacterium]MBT6201228.1 adenylate kinase [Bacteroidetes Order II. bacterium]MBT6599545.1 adenylate kinase [Bacteroidetes Order II. bacterium]